MSDLLTNSCFDGETLLYEILKYRVLK